MKCLIRNLMRAFRDHRFSAANELPVMDAENYHQEASTRNEAHLTNCYACSICGSIYMIKESERPPCWLPIHGIFGGCGSTAILIPMVRDPKVKA